MSTSAFVVLDELDDLDTLLAETVRRAGHGPDARVARRLDAQARIVGVLVDDTVRGLIEDAVDAGKRVMDAADPAAPKLMLDVAQRNLLAAVRRYVRVIALQQAA